MRMLANLLFATILAPVVASAQYFAPAVLQSIPTNAGAFKVTDGDGDGDLLYFNDGSATLADAVLVIINQGSIATSFFSFYLPVPAATSHSLDTADIDDDGDQDIVTAKQTSSSTRTRSSGTTASATFRHRLFSASSRSRSGRRSRRARANPLRAAATAPPSG